MVDIERLRVLLDAATPGPLCIAAQPGGWHDIIAGGSRLAWVTSRVHDQDAALIAEAVNALPDLLGELAALRWFHDQVDAITLNPPGGPDGPLQCAGMICELFTAPEHAPIERRTRGAQ